MFIPILDDFFNSIDITVLKQDKKFIKNSCDKSCYLGLVSIHLCQ